MPIPFILPHTLEAHAREMVCRILYRFAEAGAIQINRTEFVFTDRDLLDDFAQHTG